MVSQSPAGSAAEDAGPSGEASLQETHPVCRRVGHQDARLFGHNFTHSLSRVQRWHVARLAPAKNSSESREKVGDGAGRLPGVWKLGRSQVWLSGKVQLNANTSLCRQGAVLNVGALGFRPPPVGQVQQLQSEERAVGRRSAVAAKLPLLDR